MQPANNILGLDVGERRIGLAVVSDGVAVPRSLPALSNDETFKSKLQSLINEKDITKIIVGLPRNLNGDETPQTATVRQFVDDLFKDIDIPMEFKDEALTSAIAEDILKAGDNSYEKGEIDSLAACHILLDYLNGV